MYLEKLEINGFKSFAHKATLEFKPGITAVVGPNGSGKSNISDAMRWVLGEQSLKLLRGKKSEDVIFSGSDKKARLGMAEVSLHFNNEKDEADIGMSQIVITRKVYRSGESEYLINNKKTRLTDIQMLLAKAGVARTSYSIIGQGMIDAFLLASPQERKEFFEEASGVKPLQLKRSQALSKLEQTEENLETSEIQLKEITPRLNSLTRQVKRLEQREGVENELKELQDLYYGSLWSELNENWQTKNNNLKRLVEEEEEVAKKAGELQEQLAELTKDNQTGSEVDNLQQEYHRLVSEKMQTSKKLSEKQISHIEHEQKIIIKQTAIPGEIAKSLPEKIKVLYEHKNKLEDLLVAENWAEVKNVFQDHFKQIEKLHQLLSPYLTKNQKKEEDEKEKQAKQQQKEVAEEEIKKLTQKIEELDNKISNLEEIIKQKNQEQKQERGQIWQIQQAYQKIQQTLNQKNSQINSLRIELARIETRRDDIKQDIENDLGSVEYLSQPKQHLSEEEKREFVTKIAKLKHQLELIGGIDEEVKEEYDQIKTRHEFLESQISDLKKSLESLEKMILELDETVRKQFEQNFKIINDEFQKHFKTLFAGGKSQLVLVKNSEQDYDTEEAESSEESEVEKIKDRLKSNVYAGVEIEATPPGKKLKSIGMLSGGERAMTSIALLCAILSAKPSPFVVLDEVDAALDEANSLRFAEIVEELSAKSQFIVITHNRATMEKADILYGVTMGDDGISELLSLKLEAAEKYTNR